MICQNDSTAAGGPPDRTALNNAMEGWLKSDTGKQTIVGARRGRSPVNFCKLAFIAGWVARGQSDKKS